MEDTQFAGVKNVSGAPAKSMFDGRPIKFEKDEIKVLAVGLVQFLVQRSHLISDGKVLVRKHLFQPVPLMDALKHVKAPENKSVAAAKKEAEDKEKEKAALRSEIIAELKAEGLIVSKKA